MRDYGAMSACYAPAQCKRYTSTGCAFVGASSRAKAAPDSRTRFPGFASQLAPTQMTRRAIDGTIRFAHDSKPKAPHLRRFTMVSKANERAQEELVAEFQALIADTEQLLDHTASLAGAEADELRLSIHVSLKR